MYCKKCGQEVSELDIYCPYCSDKVSHTDSEEEINLDNIQAENNTYSIDDLLDMDVKVEKIETKNIDQDYEKYKKSIFNKKDMQYDLNYDDLDDFDDDDEYKGILTNKILIVLIVIAFVTAAGLAAKFLFFGDRLIANQDDQTPTVEDQDDENKDSEEPNKPNEDTEDETTLSQREQIISNLTAQNYNILEVRSNEELKYDSTITYKEEDIHTSTPVTNEVWKEIGGIPAYYEEAIIKALVRFNSKWIDYVNNNDKTVISLVEKDSRAYKNIITFNRGDTQEEFLLFEIGEIRKGKNGYYVWTHEKIKVVKDGESKIREYDWIYKLVEGEYDFFISNYYKN